MDVLFLKILNMSISASWLILAIVLFRALLKKAPKWINCVLWALVAVRLLCPISFESSMSLVPNPEPIPPEIFMVEPPETHTDTIIDPTANSNLPDVPSTVLDTTVDMMQTRSVYATLIWMSGVAAMIAYAAISYIRVRRKVKASLRLRDRIWICDDIQSPFIFGCFKPKIYIPSGTDEAQLPHIIAHENAHLKRRDHWWKPLGYLVLAIHWFNPFVWGAYILLCQDIELACDEKVIRGLNQSESIAYSEALLSCSVNRRSVMVCPLAFGEVGVKERVKRVLSYKKPAFWIVVLAVISCVIVAACFLTNPAENEPDLSFLNYENAISLVDDIDEVMAIYCPPSADNSGSSIQIGAATGTDLAKQLDNWKWKECSAPHQSLPSSGSVEFIIEEDYRLTVHQRKSGSLRQYAVVRYQDDVRYYSIDKNDYADAVALVHTPTDTSEDKSIGKTYTYEKEGFYGGDFQITLYDNGTFTYYEGMASSYLGTGTWDQNGNIISLKDDENVGYGFINHFMIEEDSLIFIEKDSSNFIYIKVTDGERFNLTDKSLKPIQVPAEQIGFEEDALDTAISKAIHDYYASDEPNGLIHVESYKTLLTSHSGRSGEDLSEATVYLLVLHEKFRPDTDVTKPFEEVGGSYIPTVLTFGINQATGYVLEEYWVPRDGGYYTDDINKKFPEEVLREVWNDQDYVDALEAENQQKALKVLTQRGNFRELVDGLLAAICSSPSTSSIPEDYIQANRTEYDELLSYGESTLKFCFTEFLKGDQTDLRGQIMAYVCRDIMINIGDDYLSDVEKIYTAQDWFDKFKEDTENMKGQISPEDLEKYHPASWVLLQMINE